MPWDILGLRALFALVGSLSFRHVSGMCSKSSDSGAKGLNVRRGGVKRAEELRMVGEAFAAEINVVPVRTLRTQPSGALD